MPKRPNVLFIMTDDQAPWTLSAQGHPNAHTPEIDKLARQGVLFDNCFANAAVCSPSRATLITGRYPTETGINPDGNVYVVQTNDETGLTPGIATWPAALRDAGYATALIGKWHLGHVHDEHYPTEHGYEVFSGWLHGGRCSRDPSIIIDREPRDFKGQYTSDVLTDIAMDTIGGFKDRPFAMSLHYWAPHANNAVPDDFELPYQDRTWLPLREEDLAPWRDAELTIPNPEFPNLDLDRVRRMTREYHASVHSVDRNVGRLMSFLEREGLAEDTIVVFTSDQGYNMAHHGLWHKGNGRWITKKRQDPDGVYGNCRDNLFDNSLRVPCVMRWPRRFPHPFRLSEMVSFVDWFPTLLEMTETSAPDHAVSRGRGFLPLLNGEDVDWENGVFAQHRALRCFRDAEWKLVRDFGDAKLDELYHVWEDPCEKRNLIGEDNALIEPIKRRLDERIRRVMTEIGDPMGA